MSQLNQKTIVKKNMRGPGTTSQMKVIAVVNCKTIFFTSPVVMEDVTAATLFSFYLFIYL